jgi:subfamily B ATP-binding cassette protein MsbA
MGDMTETTGGILGGIKIVQAYNAEEHESSRFHSDNQRYYRHYVRMKRLQALATPYTEFLGAVALVALLWFGGQIVFRGELSASTLMVFFYAMGMLLNPLKKLSHVYSHIQQGMAAMDRVVEIIDMEPAIKSLPDAPKLDAFTKDIIYDKVNFAYNEGEWVIKDVSLNIKKGMIVALVGPSGAGKTTFVDLLPRFYDIQQGGISVDGRNIKEYDLKSLRSLMGIVPQEIFLTSGTVKSNIAYGEDEPDMDRIISSAKAANAHDFIMELPSQYETKTGERGVLLSGGQRQRIAIARAIYQDPPILILDEATSSLDSESERMVQDALNNLMENRTVLVIAHRISTVQKADLIVVIEDGRIVQQGIHQELIALEGTYQKLYSLQFQE